MKALCYYGAHDIRYESMDDPVPQSERDAIVKVSACAICGSDLHIYHGHGFSEDIGFCVGHEAVGEVVETGRGVSRLKVGDKVMIPAAVGCGSCRACLSGVVNLCENGMAGCYGLSAKLQGSQAEAVRVPAADVNAVPIPDGVTEEQALLMTDALATAWFGARNADIVPGSSVAVIGCGPIGLMAVDSAFVMGAHVVYAIDPVPERQPLLDPLDPKFAVPEFRTVRPNLQIQSILIRFAVGGISWLKPTDFCGFQGHLGATPFFPARCPQICPLFFETW